jgi:hypothetical protein
LIDSYLRPAEYQSTSETRYPVTSEGYEEVLSYGIIVHNVQTPECISSMSERANRLVTVNLPRRLGWPPEYT